MDKVLKCKFLRNHRGSDDTYIFPAVDNIDNVSFDQVSKVLTVLSVKRG